MRKLSAKSRSGNRQLFFTVHVMVIKHAITHAENKKWVQTKMRNCKIYTKIDSIIMKLYMIKLIWCKIQISMTYWIHFQRDNWKCGHHSCRWICCWKKEAFGGIERQWCWSFQKTHCTQQEPWSHEPQSYKSKIVAPSSKTMKQIMDLKMPREWREGQNNEQKRKIGRNRAENAWLIWVEAVLVGISPMLVTPEKTAT